MTGHGHKTKHYTGLGYRRLRTGYTSRGVHKTDRMERVRGYIQTNMTDESWKDISR